MQIYTEAKKSKDQFVIEGVNTVWPSKLFTQVTLEAQKSYSSTSSSGGKLVFNINKTPKEIPNVEQAATTDAPGASQAGELVDYMPADSGVTARAGGVDNTEPLGTPVTLGRSRQK